MKIATWNVNSLRARLGHVTRWLDEHRPDVLLLQETKVADELFPHDPFIERGYYTAVHGQKSYNGVAILSRLPLVDVQPGFPSSSVPVPDDLATPAQSRLLAATIEAIIDGQKISVRVLSAYVPNGGELDSPKFSYKAAFYRYLTTCLAAANTSQTPPWIVGGDFNIAAAARDTDNPEKRVKDVLFTPAEQQWLADFQAQTNLSDAFRLISEEEKVFSWWDYRAGAFETNRGLRIDYLFVSPTLKSAVTMVEHHKAERTLEAPSDHIPVLLTLK